MRKIFFLLMIASAVISYYYHREVHEFFIKTYYTRILKENLKTSAIKAEKLYNNKKYDELMNYLNRLMIIYPENKEFKKLSGFANIKAGDKLKGARLILGYLDTIGKRTNEKEIFIESIGILFNEKWYSDVINELTGFPIGNNTALNYYNGVSLLKLGRYKDALKYFIKLEERDNTNSAVYYYIGLIYEKENRNREAIKSLEESLSLNPYDTETKYALIRVYGKEKMFDKAEKLLRKRRL